MKYKLVYFDDQIQNIECYESMLSDSFEVIGCTVSTDYEKIMKRHRPHAFLIDLHMPELDGFELYEKIINHPSYNGCPIFFITGYPTQDKRIQSIETGGIDFLERDLSKDEVISRFVNKIRVYFQGAKILDFGNLRLDMTKFKAYINGKDAELTLLEMRLFSLVSRHYPEKLNTTFLMEKMWPDNEVKPGTLNTHLCNLGVKLWDWNYCLKIKKESLSFCRKNQ